MDLSMQRACMWLRHLCLCGSQGGELTHSGVKGKARYYKLVDCRPGLPAIYAGLQGIQMIHNMEASVA